MESDIEILCRKKEKELLEKYFRGGTDCPFKNCNPENIGPYTKELGCSV